MRCNRCGAEVFDGEIYCGECGTKLNTQNNIQQDNYYGKKKSKGNKTLLVILVVIVILVVLGIIGNMDSDNTETNNTQNLSSSNNSSNVNTNTNNQSTNTNTNSIYNNSTNTNTNYNDNETTTNTNITNNENTSNSQTNTNEEEFKKDNEKAYTKYSLLFDDGEISDNIYLEIEGRYIYLYNKDSEMSYTGTYTSSNGYLVGTYTEVTYNNGGDIETESINDSFKFEILPNHKLKDILGYGQWCGQTFGQNFTYVLD